MMIAKQQQSQMDRGGTGGGSEAKKKKNPQYYSQDNVRSHTSQKQNVYQSNVHRQKAQVYYNEKIERELQEYKVEIERRFAKSKMNNFFVFPRVDYLSQSEEESEYVDFGAAGLTSEELNSQFIDALIKDRELREPPKGEYQGMTTEEHWSNYDTPKLPEDDEAHMIAMPSCIKVPSIKNLLST